MSVQHVLQATRHYHSWCAVGLPAAFDVEATCLQRQAATKELGGGFRAVHGSPEQATRPDDPGAAGRAARSWSSTPILIARVGILGVTRVSRFEMGLPYV